MAKRKKLPVDVKQLVLHEAGYKCGNPVCRHIITLDIHHLVMVADGGPDDPSNLLALCPNCHALHHRGAIPAESVRAWKMLLMALNSAYDQRSIELLLMLKKIGVIKNVTGDGLIPLASLYASELVWSEYVHQIHLQNGILPSSYTISLSEKGKLFVDAWIEGDQKASVELIAGQ